MKKVTLIGDCHSLRILEHWDPNSCPIKLKIWGKGGTKAWNINLNQMKNFKEKSEKVEYGFIYYDIHDDKNNVSISFDQITNQDLILVWIGYVDIKNFLPLYNNSEIVVKKYIENFVKYFKNSNVRFIEPFPQFKETILHPEEELRAYSYEQRMYQNKKFIKNLRKFSKKFNLKEPISQEKIYKAIGFDVITQEMTPDYEKDIVDGLKREYMSKIYDLIIEEALKE
jgi:hypothetical protein